MSSISLKDALIKLLECENKEISLEEIYMKIEDFYPARDFQNEPDPKYPYATRLQHAIRHNLSELKKEGIIIHTKRSHYKIK